MIKAKILPDMSLFQALIYNDTINPNVIYNTKDVVQMYSTFMEPSYYGAFLVGLFYYYLSEWNGNKNIIYLVLIFISIIFTKSTTAYLGLFITFIFFIFSNSQKKSLRIILPLIIFFSLFLSIFYSKLLDQVIFNKFSSSSAKVRSNWNKSAFYAFKDNILFGTGFKNYRASSLLFSIIANLGLMGILMYLSLIYSIIKTKTKSVKKYNYVVKSKMMLFGVVISQFIACPDLDFCVFWFAMYSLALFQSKNRI
ncbi:MAG: O-antigen ligase family protein [Sphaerochaetaceae bacterium]|nr:O-antigen ligase family protein [Sphaerochaetaceae bacterium]